MPRGLAIAAGIARGASKFSANMFNIMQAKEKTRKEDELFALNKKEKELKIKKMEIFDISPEMIELQKQGLKAETETYKTKQKQTDLAIKEATLKNEKLREELIDKATISFLSGQSLEAMPEERASMIAGRFGQRYPAGIPGGRMAFDEETLRQKALESTGLSRGTAFRKDVGLETVKESNKEQLNLASGLRKEFNQDKSYKDFQTIQRSESAMNQALQLALNPNEKSRIASDQALGVLFQKMLDPDSVVRESEYARTPEGAALFNRISAFIPRLQKGGLALKDEDRKALYEVAKKLLIESKKTFNQHIDRYTEIADLYDVNPKMIFGNIEKFAIEGEKAAVENRFNELIKTMSEDEAYKTLIKEGY